MSEVVKILEAIGPSLGSTIAQELQTQYSLKPATARKRIERAKAAKTILALESIRFRYNEQFLYLPEQADSNRFLTNLRAALLQVESPMGDCVEAIHSRGGLIPANLFETLSGLPFRGPAKLSASDSKRFLLEWKLIRTVESSLGTSFVLNPSVFGAPDLVSRVSSRLRAEQAFLYALLDWLRLQGMVTANKASLRSQGIEPPQFGFFAWDLVAPSYIAPLVYRSKDEIKPGFVVADVCLGRDLRAEDVQYFVNKCRSAAAQLNRPCIPMLVARWFDPAAFATGRKYGLLFTTPKNLFGASFAAMLDSMIELLDQQESIGASLGQQVTDLLSKLSSFTHLEGLLGNVLADTFELIVGHCIQQHGGKVSFGRKFTDRADDKAYDSDVLLLQPEQKVIAVECKKKTLTSLVSVPEVEHWFEKVAPLVYAELMQDRWFKDVPFEFSLWTTSDFHPDALAKLESIKAQTKSRSITWKNGKEVLEAIETTRDTKLLDAFRNYFYKKALPAAIQGPN